MKQILSAISAICLFVFSSAGTFAQSKILRLNADTAFFEQDNKPVSSDTVAVPKMIQGIETGMKNAAHGIKKGVIGAARGTEKGVTGAAYGIEKGAIEAARGTEKGVIGAARGTEKGVTGAAHGIEKGAIEAARGISAGSDGITTGVGHAAYNETRMFYNPSKEFDSMDSLVFEEKAIKVETGITIHSYYFKCDSPKANIFLVHGNEGNVSTYKTMISNLLKGNYNVYAVDWRGYGKSTGNPDYKGVLKDTEVAFDDFITSTRNDSLKTIVYGMSLGGQIATKLVCDNQQYINGLVLDGSLSSALNLAADFMPFQFLKNNMEKNADMFNQEYVAERDIACITEMPKLIIHSENDEVVLFYHGKILFEKALEPKYFWKTNTRHIGTLEELPDETMYKLDKFISHVWE